MTVMMPNWQLVLAGARVLKELVVVRLGGSVVRADCRLARQRVARSTTAGR